MPHIVLAACIEAEGGIGGTGMPLINNQVAGEGGIGGTGAQANGGIGGTGIVGTITGFASVCINGLEVDFDDATQVSSNGNAAGIRNLAVGQVIAIDAVDGPKRLLAHKIDILNAVEGPVTSINPSAGLVEVIGQKIRLSDATLLGGIAAVQEISVGMPLKVSGYRNADNEIIATRIEIAHGKADASIVGMVARDSSGHFVVSGTPVQAKESMLVAGAEVLLKGKWDGRQFNAESAQHDPSLYFAGHVRQVVVEGLLIDRMGGQQMKISGYDIDYSSSTSVAGGGIEQLIQGQRVRVTGRIQAGRRLQANHIEIMQRPDVLGRMSGVMHDGKDHKNQHGEAQPMPDRMRNNMPSHPDPLRQPMPAMSPNRPMPMMNH
ncbi:hypothetical protein UT5_20030 [Ferrigenium sp. UT5]